MSFFHKKNKETVSAEESENAAPRLVAGTVIRTMPNKFLVVEEKRRFWTPVKIWSVVVVVVLALVGVSYWLVRSGVTINPTVVDPESTNTAEVTNNQPEEEATNPGTLPGSLFPEETPTIPVVESPPSPVVPAPSAPITAILPKSSDADSDGLTDVEETLFGTNPAKPDSDSDGYTDFDELKNGYSPIGEGTLEASTLFTTYSDPAGRFTAHHPLSWATRAIGRDGVQFVSASEESIAVLSQSNPEKLSLSEWYRTSVSGVGEIIPALETVGDKNGLFSQDRQTFYFSPGGDAAVMYVVSLTSAAKTSLDFRSTFELFIRSFRLTRR